MSVAGRIAGAVAGLVGVAAAGAAVQVATRNREIHARSGEEHVAYGSLRGEPMVVVTDDGLDLYVEVDEADPAQQIPGAQELTVLFVHGFALNMDCWHEQRAHLRGKVRMVFYDQRSHGRSARSAPQHCRIPQLGRDLQRVLETTCDGPVLVIAHSMGGMSLIQAGEQLPEQLGERIVGAGLVSTTAGGLDPAKVIVPLLPPLLSGSLLKQGVRALERTGRTVDVVRRWGKDIASVATDSWSFGGPVSADLVAFSARMIDQTPFSVVADFYPSFDDLDLCESVSVFSAVPTTIVCGTKDRITGIAHSRALHARIHGSDLVEVENAGHLVLLEKPDRVNAALDDLLDQVLQRLEGVAESSLAPARSTPGKPARRRTAARSTPKDPR